MRSTLLPLLSTEWTLQGGNWWPPEDCDLARARFVIHSVLGI